MDTPTLFPALAAGQRPPKTQVPVIDHGLKAMALQRDHALRTLSAAIATAQVLPRTLDGETLDDLWTMQAAVRERFAQMQRSWLEGWFGWLSYSGQIEGANTLSKLAEREYNLAAQAVQMAGEQCEDLLGLMENVQVGYLYWIRRKGEAADA
jgi:hypothetical protein